MTEVFSRAVVMPNNVRGQNRWRPYHQLVHCAALNSFTPDIRWLESALGIDARTQRIARTGQEIYQALMRLSLREPTARADVTLVVMDRDVAEWLVQWFVPRGQVEVVGSRRVGRDRAQPLAGGSAGNRRARDDECRKAGAVSPAPRPARSRRRPADRVKSEGKGLSFPLLHSLLPITSFIQFGNTYYI